MHRLSALAPAIGPDGNIYVSGEDELVIKTINKYLYSVNPAGAASWTYAFGECQITAPAIARDGTVYIGKDDGSLYAFHPDGSVAWTCDVGGAIGTTVKYVNADPAVGRDGTVYVTMQAPALCALSAAGALLWSVPLAAQAQGTASISKDGALHVNCADGKLYVFNPDGTPRWNYTTGVSQASPTLDVNGTVYVGSDNGNLFAIRADGTLKWTFTAVDAIQAQPTISENGSLVFMDIDGWLYCLGPGGG